MRFRIRAGKTFLGKSPESIVDHSTIIICDGRIESVSFDDADTPDQNKPIGLELDAENYFVMPGLTDLHVHLSASADPNYIASALLTPSEYVVLRAQSNASKTLDAGFTTVRDAGAAGYYIISLRNAINSGVVKGSRIFASGRILTETGGHADAPYFGGRVCDGEIEVRKAVREQIKMTADFIKICTSGGGMSSQDDPNEPQFNLQEISAIVDEAHRKHRKVAAHAQANIGIRNAVDSGVDTIEHALNLDEETCKVMIKNQTIIVPTLVAPLMISNSGAGSGVPDWAIRKTKEALEPHKLSISMAKRMGVKIGFGTDAGTPFNNHGSNAKEFKMMVERGGLSEADAIFSLTGIAAEALGKQKSMGSLETGKVADLVIVKGDPLTNISILEDPSNIILVMKDGRIEKKLENRI